MQRKSSAGPGGVLLCSAVRVAMRSNQEAMRQDALVCLQVLEREERSLGSLLEDFCGVRKQKQHQRADWRQR